MELFSIFNFTKLNGGNLELKVHPDIKALIFDLDGTLADTMPLHLQAWQLACKEYGFQYPDEWFYELAGLSSSKIAHIIVERRDLQDKIYPEEFAGRKEDIFHGMKDQIQPIMPVVKLVYQYFMKIPMAIGSGGNRKAVNETLEILQLKRYFKVIVAAEDVKNHKPAPDTFLKCAELLKTAPVDCLVFEDGDRGIEAAKRAGMNVVDITPWHPKVSTGRNF